MSKSWRWANSFNSKKLIGNRVHHSDVIRNYINKHGVHAIDSGGYSVFSVLSGFIGIMHGKRVVDIIFEHKPDLREFSNGRISLGHSFLKLHDCHILYRFLEQDTEYQYVRSPYVHFGVVYPNFMSFLDKSVDVKKDEFPIGFRYYKDTSHLFKNHFYKGITFFELMKQRLLK